MEDVQTLVRELGHPSGASLNRLVAGRSPAAASGRGDGPLAGEAGGELDHLTIRWTARESAPPGHR
jgi:hypothetical protein